MSASSAAKGKAAQAPQAPQQKPVKKDASKDHVERAVIVDPEFYKHIRKTLTPESMVKLAEAQKELEETPGCVYNHEYGMLQGLDQRLAQEVTDGGLINIGIALGTRLNYPYTSTNPEPAAIMDTVKNKEGKILQHGSCDLLHDLQTFFTTIKPMMSKVSFDQMEKFHDTLGSDQKKFFSPLMTVMKETYKLAGNHPKIVKHLSGIEKAVHDLQKQIKHGVKREGLPKATWLTGIPQLLSGQKNEEAQKAREKYLEVFFQATGIRSEAALKYLQDYKKDAVPKQASKPRTKRQRASKPTDAIENDGDDEDHASDIDDPEDDGVDRPHKWAAIPAPKGGSAGQKPAKHANPQKQQASAGGRQPQASAGWAPSQAPAGDSAGSGRRVTSFRGQVNYEKKSDEDVGETEDEEDSAGHGAAPRIAGDQDGPGQSPAAQAAARAAAQRAAAAAGGGDGGPGQ